MTTAGGKGYTLSLSEMEWQLSWLTAGSRSAAGRESNIERGWAAALSGRAQPDPLQVSGAGQGRSGLQGPSRTRCGSLVPGGEVRGGGGQNWTDSL